MKYNKFLFKNTLFLVILYVLSIAGTFLIHMFLLKDTPLKSLLLSTMQTSAWLITSYIFFIDMNNNMISRLIINGGSRSGIWLSKGLAVIIAAVMMTAVQAAAIIIDNGSLKGCYESLFNVSVLTLLVTLFLGTLTALLCVLIKNMSVVIILIFAYVSPWTYSLVANYCEKSSSYIIKNNPFYSLLKMSNTGTFDKTGMIGCCLTGAVLWLISFVIMQRKELKEDN